MGCERDDWSDKSLVVGLLAKCFRRRCRLGVRFVSWSDVGVYIDVRDELGESME